MNITNHGEWGRLEIHLTGWQFHTEDSTEPFFWICFIVKFKPTEHWRIFSQKSDHCKWIKYFLLKYRFIFVLRKRKFERKLYLLISKKSWRIEITTLYTKKGFELYLKLCKFCKKIKFYFYFYHQIRTSIATK